MWTLSGWVVEWIPPGSVTVDDFELQYGVGDPESIYNSATEAIRSADWFSDSNSESNSEFSDSDLPVESDDSRDSRAYYDFSVPGGALRWL